MLQYIGQGPLQQPVKSDLVSQRDIVRKVSFLDLHIDLGSRGELGCVRLHSRNEPKFIKHGRAKVQHQTPHRVDGVRHEGDGLVEFGPNLRHLVIFPAQIDHFQVQLDQYQIVADLIVKILR